jgi:uncharacterized protein YxjI
MDGVYMKKIITILFSLGLFISSGWVLADEIPNRIPDELYITEHWISLTTSYDIDTKTQHLGTLYRRFLSLMLTYDFYDPFDHKLAYAYSKFLSLTAHFDVYDTNDSFLGAADERLFTFFPKFDIYARDGYRWLATAAMNFWGTTFYIYDPVTHYEMAYMTRSFFRIKNNWTFHVRNRELFDQKEIDPRVLMTVIAFQGDREYWEQQNKNLALNTISKSNSDVSSEAIKAQLVKTSAQCMHEGFIAEQAPDEQTARAVAEELEQGFNNAHASNPAQTDEEHMLAFTDYCLNLVASNTLAEEKKRVVLFLLKTRLERALD